jgi:hypothetical protein
VGLIIERGLIREGAYLRGLLLEREVNRGFSLTTLIQYHTY